MLRPDTLNDSAPADHSQETLADLWVASYRFSQGLPKLQKGIISYACREALPDSIIEDQEIQAASFKLAKQKIGVIVDSSSHTGGGRKQDAIESDFKENVIATVNAPLLLGPIEGLLSKVLQQTIGRDATYLPANNHNSQRTFGSVDGRYYSYAVRYILLSAATGQPAITQLFSRVRPLLPNEAGQLIRTYEDRAVMGLHSVPKNSFWFSDIVSQHLEDNPSDMEEVEKAAAELRMRV